MVGDLRECLKILVLFGIPPQKDLRVFNQTEYMEAQDTIIQLFESYCKVNKENDIVGVFSVLSEINLYLNLLILRHGGATVFREVNNATIKSILNKYDKPDNTSRITVRDSKGKFIEYEQLKDYTPEITVNQNEVDIRTQIDEILTKYNIFK